MKKISYAYFFILLAFFLTQSPCIHAQKRYLFHTYTVKDGLPENAIFCINQDRKGYLWISTDGGISRFDGRQFDNTVIPEVNREKLFSQYIDKSPSGRLAFATFMQGVMAEQENGSFRQYLRRKKQLGKNVVRTLKWISDTKIITSESRNINLIDGDSVRQIYDCGVNKNMFQTLEYDGNGNIWFGGIDGLGVIFADDKTKTPFILPELKGVFTVKILFFDKHRLLAGTDNGYYELSILSAKKNDFRYTVKQPFDEMKNKPINHIYKDRQKCIWVSFIRNGVCQIRDNQIVRWIKLENGLPSDGVMCVFQDNENNYWFGTSDGVLRLYSTTDFSYAYNGKPITGVGVFAMDTYKQLILVDESMFYQIKDNSIKPTPIAQTMLSKSGVLAFDFQKEKSYFFTDSGIYRTENSIHPNWKKMTMLVDFKKNNLQDMKSYYFDNNEVLLLGFTDGLYAYKNSKVKKLDVLSDKELKMHPKEIVKDKYGYYWVGDYTYGLHRLKANGTDADGMPKLRHIQSYESLKPDSAFATAWIQALMLDSKENLWVSSLYIGVYKLKIDASGVKKATLYSTKNGLSINDVSQIVEGKDKSVWFATRNGADRLYTDKKGNEKIIHYNNKNGFGSLVYQILPDDSVTYISFQEGVYVINNSLNNSEDNRPLSVLISKVSVMGKPDTTALMSGDKPYALPYNRNYISFEYGVVRLKDSEGIDYQYKLDGIDKEWSEYSTYRYASYNSLPPGKYTFRVRAKTINNDESGAVTSYSFRINPPFYRTWWFFILLLAVFTSIGYVIYNQRIMQLIKIQKLRNKIASDLHDDVGSTLSSISIMSDLLQSQLDNSSRSEQMIRTIGANAHTMLDSMDDIIWSVNPANDKFQNLALRVREYAIPLFEMKNIRFSIDAPEEMNALQMPMDVRRNLYLIAKEAVNNLVKYSHASQADISFGYAYNALTMSVKDNGQGFDLENAKRNRNGLVNMRQRAEQIRGTLTINSEIGKGTCVTLQVKII